MKKISYLILFLMSCASVPEESYQTPKVIKYNKFGKVFYDTFDEIEFRGAYAIYIKNNVEVLTNYIYGEFETMTYGQYLNRKNK